VVAAKSLLIQFTIYDLWFTRYDLRSGTQIEEIRKIKNSFNLSICGGKELKVKKQR
jgi:hypothetical protein